MIREKRRAEERRRRRGEGRIDCGDDEDDDGEDRRENLWGENYCLTPNQVGLLSTAKSLGYRNGSLRVRFSN